MNRTSQGHQQVRKKWDAWHPHIIRQVAAIVSGTITGFAAGPPKVGVFRTVRQEPDGVNGFAVAST
jgi:hypothetical protein